MKSISKAIQDKITAIGTPEKARWLENYVKHDIKSKGVGIPKIREVIIGLEKEFKISEQSIEDQIELLDNLMYQAYTEDKLCAILYLQLFWAGKNTSQTLALISKWFDQNYISDWNVCDWLCVRILTPLLDNVPKTTIPELKKWYKDKNLWKARASLVPFAQSKSIVQHKSIIQEFSTVLIQREERFCKTSVGWVLRTYSKHDPEFVKNFLIAHENWTTREVINNAMKYINKQKS